VFVTHGEPSAAAEFAEHIDRGFGWHPEIPADGSTVALRE
jgi:hypothetical protein